MIKADVIVKNKDWFKFIKNPTNYLKQRLQKIKKDKFFSKKKNYHLSILLASSKEIRILNKRFRNKNKSTDVLSFPFYKKKDLKKNLLNLNKVYLGDIIINLNKLDKKSGVKVFKKSFDRLWIHSLVHLFGYQHKKYKDFKKMNQIERKFQKILS